ncbi:MAG: PA14 domain-containing protein [Planctomycetota bacterium]
MTHQTQPLGAMVALLIAVLSAGPAAADFGASFDLDADGSVDARRAVPHVGVESLRAMGVDPGRAFDAAFDGAVRVEADGLYRVQVRGTHTWRLEVNGVPVLDYTHAKGYEKAIAEAGHWSRLSEAVLPLRAGVAYPVRLTYHRPAALPEVAGEVSLSIGPVGGPLSPAVSVAPRRPSVAPHPARPAAAFHASVGLVVNKLQRFSDAEYEQLKARLGEIGVPTIRGNFYPWVTERENLDRRYRDLHESLGVELSGVVRESFSIDDPDAMMADLAAWVDRASDYLAIVEGPNEPYGKTENFNYRGHGRQHRTGTPLGDGWTRGVSLFMRDLHATLADPSDAADGPVIAAASTVFGPWRPDNPLAAFAHAEGIPLGDTFTLNNMHKYHMAWPNARFYEHQRKLREQTPDAPWIITEMGWNSGDIDHDQVSPDRKTAYTLRNHLLGFNAGSSANYTFALYHHQPMRGKLKAFGLLDKDFNPRPAFHALRRLVELTRDDDCAAMPDVAGELAYRLDVRRGAVEPMRTLLAMSDGGYRLIFWLETGQTDNRSGATLRLPAAMKITAWQPTDRDEPTDQVVGDRLEFVITGDPVVIQLDPVTPDA